MKKYFILLSLIPSALMAQTIGVEDAQNKALQFMQGQSQTRASQREVQLKLAYTSKSGDETYYYVFNNANGGYVIMGGDEAAREVLGYGETGSFDYERIPDNMRWWLGQYDAQISQAIREVKAGTNKVVRQSQTRAERAEIPVLLTTKWGQDKPYNMQLPTSQSGEVDFPTGCGNTAMAQIMNYHRWPDTGVGSNTLETEYFGHKFTADFENTHYDWDAMADSYDTIYSGTREEIAVGTLMYHVGVANNSLYNKYYTSTYIVDIAYSLIKHFRYNKGMSCLLRSFYSDAEWESIIYDELSRKYPVFYRADTETNSGHAFVCDGYRDGLFHINWGWYGMYNNYFLLTATSTEKALCPGGTGTGGGEEYASYTEDQRILTGIFPDPDGSSQYKKSLSFNFSKLNNSIFAVGDTVALSISFQNLGLNLETFDVRYRLVNVEDSDDYFVFDDTYSFTLDSYESQKLESTFCIPEGANQGATYKLIPMFKDEKGEWRQILIDNSLCFSQILIAHDFTLTKPLSVRSEGYICNDVFFDLSFSVKNLSDSTLTCPLALNIYPYVEGNPDPVDYFELGEISLAPNEERKVVVGTKNLHFGDRLELGKFYKFKLENYVDGSLLASFSCLIVDSVPISLTVPEMGWTTFAIPYDTEIPEGLKAYSVTYDKNEDSIVLEEQDFLRMNRAYLLHGAPGTYQVVGPALELDNPNLRDLYGHKEDDPLVEDCCYVLDQRDGIVGFYRIKEPTTIGKYEAYLLSYSSKDVIVIEDPDADDPTGFQQITTPGTPFDSRIYDLNGRIINVDHNGIVIRDGKVFIIK